MLLAAAKKMGAGLSTSGLAGYALGNIRDFAGKIKLIFFFRLFKKLCRAFWTNHTIIFFFTFIIFFFVEISFIDFAFSCQCDTEANDNIDEIVNDAKKGSTSTSTFIFVVGLMVGCILHYLLNND
jgi:hypothetical protein